jgi:hypothetical protein
MYLISKKLQKNIYMNYFRRNNYKIRTAVVHCFPKVLDAIVLENINLPEDKIWRSALWSKQSSISVISRLYILCQHCIFQPNVNFICTYDLEVFNFSEKMT